MSKVVAALAVALIGSASADEWPSLRIDASSHRAFERSLETANEELSPENVQMLGGALKHIWNEGMRAAEAALQYSAASEAAARTAPWDGRASGAATSRYRHPKSDDQFPRMPNSDSVPHGGTDLFGSGQR